MAVCTECGESNPDRARICRRCGLVFSEPTQTPDDIRKTVTVVFSDVVGSTDLGGRLDPESVREIMRRFFDEMKIIVERHGGIVEKFIGDAVMAAFGIPVVHEDDALRAVRSAAEMRSALKNLNREFELEWDASIRVRIGVNTGEVVAGDPSTGQGYASGDTVNTAARLEQNAAPDQILLGRDTFLLVRDAVSAKEVAPLKLKGKAEPVQAWSLLSVAAGAPGVARALDTPLVGRTEELQSLERAFRSAVEDASCRLVTVAGLAGTGKSRVAEELIARLEDQASVVKGQCLPYGEGITYWPVAQVIRQRAGITDRDPAETALEKIRVLLRREPERASIMATIAAVLGLGEAAVDKNQTFWAIRKVLEIPARRPGVIIWDDIQWAEATLLELIDHLVTVSEKTALLLVCLTRPDLVERNPQWTETQAKGSLVKVDPLEPGDTEDLIEGLLGGSLIDKTLQSRIVTAAEGNPLFVEEMLRMLIDDGLLRRNDDGSWEATESLAKVEIPQSIKLLINARLDRLEPGERDVLARASVVGRVFESRTVTELLPEPSRPSLPEHLEILLRKELIEPDAPIALANGAFRFRHILTRDSAYEALTKRMRAGLHERLAKWLEESSGDRVGELAQIIGHHLEQSFLHLKDLKRLDETVKEVGRRGAGWLGRAGRSLLALGDMPAAANLLGRAVALLSPDSPQRIELQLELSSAQSEMGELEAAREAVREAIASAVQIRRTDLQDRGRIRECYLKVHLEEPEGWHDEVKQLVEECIEVFTRADDERGLAQTYQLASHAEWVQAHYGRSVEVLEKALSHSQRAGDDRLHVELMGWVFGALFWGPTPADEALVRCREMEPLVKGNRVVYAKGLLLMGGLNAMRGEFDEARRMVARSRKMLEELGLMLVLAGGTLVSGMIEVLAGDLEAAVAKFRSGYDVLKRMGDRGYAPGVAAFLARALYDLERFDEAEDFTQISKELSIGDEASTSDWGAIESKLLARRGEYAEAEALIDRVLDVASRSDELKDQADTLVDLAEILRLAGRTDEALVKLGEALVLYEAKGILPAAEKVRRLIVAYSAAPSAPPDRAT